MKTVAKAGQDAFGAGQQGAAAQPTSNYDSSKARLTADLKILVADAEEMIREAAASSADGFATLRARFEKKLAEARATIDQTRSAVGEKTQHAAAAAQTYVKENPWQSVGALAAAGAILGFCLSRRSAGPDIDVPLE